MDNGSCKLVARSNKEKVFAAPQALPEVGLNRTRPREGFSHSDMIEIGGETSRKNNRGHGTTEDEQVQRVGVGLKMVGMVLGVTLTV